jgi:peptidoglycan/LPS O-acetylase OafA/YrhL
MTRGVLAMHTRYLLPPGAVLFMDVFFVMSGYLITSLLISNYRKGGTVDLKKFYLRRFLRLYPALVAMLCERQLHARAAAVIARLPVRAPHLRNAY